MSLRLVNWNVQWATPRSPRTPEILRRIDHHSAEVICLTETHSGLLSREGYAICSQADSGYGIREGRRKVVLWSMQPWERVDDLGADSLPPGRFVSGVTRTSLGELTVVGVCIPWFGSRTEARRAGGTQGALGGPRAVPGRSRARARTRVRAAADRGGGLQSDHRAGQPRGP